MAAFRASDEVAMVVVAATPGHETEVERVVGGIAGAPGEPGSLHPVVVTGGESRSASVGHALAEVPASAEFVAVHDAARPLLEPALIRCLFERLDAAPEAAGVIAAAPITDTIKRAGADGGAIEATEPRERLWAAQTPQVFRAPVLREAHDAADATAGATDDAMLVEAVGGTVLIEPAPPGNLKLTTPTDLRLAELLLAERG